MESRTPMSPVEREAILQEIGASLVGTSSSDWEEMSFQYDALADIASSKLEVVRSDGSSGRIRPP